MSQSSVREISHEDSRLIEANQLGIPLRIYNQRPDFIRLWYNMVFSMIILGCVLLVLSILFAFLNRNVLSPWPEYLGEFGTFFLLPLMIVCGLFLLRVMVPDLGRARVIVCESGLLQRTSKRVEILHWNEILAIKEGTFSCRIIRQAGPTLLLHTYYLNFDELMAHIKQSSGQDEGNAGALEGYHLNKKQFVFQIIKQHFHRSVAPTKGDKRFLTVLYCCVGLWALMAFTFVFTASDLFAWLMYAAMGLIGVVEIALIVWRFRDIARQLKEDA